MNRHRKLMTGMMPLIVLGLVGCTHLGPVEEGAVTGGAIGAAAGAIGGAVIGGNPAAGAAVGGAVGAGVGAYVGCKEKGDCD